MTSQTCCIYSMSNRHLIEKTHIRPFHLTLSDPIFFHSFFCIYSQLSYCFYEMAPSATQTDRQHSTMTTATITATSVSNDPWCQPNQQQKENQRPPVFFPEDYILALKKFSKFGSGNGSNSNSNKSIYDTIDDVKNSKSNVTNGSNSSSKSRTLPLSKTSDYK